MNDLEKLYNDKKKYENLRKQIESLINYLDASTRNLKDAMDELNVAYIIDGEAADNKSLIQIQNELREKRNFLANTICPNIISKISKINQMIAMKEYYES